MGSAGKSGDGWKVERGLRMKSSLRIFSTPHRVAQAESGVRVDNAGSTGLHTAMPPGNQSQPTRRPEGDGAKLELPPGVKLLRTFEGHQGAVRSVAFDPSGQTLASGSNNSTVKLWERVSGKLLRTLEGHQGGVWSVAFDPSGQTLASGSNDSTVKLWERVSGKLLRTLEGHEMSVQSVAFDPSGQTLASGSYDNTVKLWERDSGKLLRTLEGHRGSVYSVAFDPSGQTLASGSVDNTVKFWKRDSGKLLRTLEGHKTYVLSVAFDLSGTTLASGSLDNTVKLWERTSGKLLRTLEGHTSWIDRIAFSSDGQLLASNSNDGTVRLWRCDTWETVAVIPAPSRREWNPALAFHPTLPLLATAAGTKDEGRNEQIHLWELDLAVLLGKTAGVTQTPREKTASYAVAKVLLVGDTGVGKTGLAERLVHQRFTPTESTHGRKVHTLEQVEVSGAHGERVQRETVLWDLAGQPGYRLIHQLQMEDAAVALVVFDARSETDPFGGAAYWSEALDQAATNTRIIKILVAARSDRGGVGINEETIQRFVKQNGFAGYIRTSAKTGEGIEDLADTIRRSIKWEDVPLVSSTLLMQAVRKFVAGCKEKSPGTALQSVAALRQTFRASAEMDVSDEEFAACLLRLEQTDVVDVLRPYRPGGGSSDGPGFEPNHGKLEQTRRPELADEDEVLLQPSYVDAYASAIIIVAKDDPRGIGHVMEEAVFRGDFALNHEERIQDKEIERKVLVHVVAQLLGHELALRESLEDGDYLVFPSQYTREAPFPGVNAFGVSYDFRGPIRNIFTTLVVRLAHNTVFVERDFYRDAAAYEARQGGKCIVLLRERVPGTGRLSVFFDGEVKEETQATFLRYVYEHLNRRAIPGSITRQREYHCRRCGYEMDIEVVERRLREGKKDIVCPNCDERQPLYDLLLQESKASSKDLQSIDEDARQAKSREVAVLRVEGLRERGEHDVFLSYNSKDRQEVLRVAENLKAVGLRPWLDVWDLVPGRPWQEALETAIDKLPCAAICYGPAGAGPWQDREVRAFLEEFVRRQKRLIPVIMPDAPGAPELPVFLRAFPWVDLRDRDVSKGSGLRLLVAGILDVPPTEIGEGVLDKMLVARIRERQRRKRLGSKEKVRLVIPLDHVFEQFDKLSEEAVKAQIAERLDIPSQYIRVVGKTEGSVKIHMEFDDADEASMFFAQISHGHPEALRQFEKWRGKKEEFLTENKDKVPEHKSGIVVGEVFHIYGDATLRTGEKTMAKQTTINVKTNYGQVGEVLNNCTNIINQQAEGAAKDLLAKLASEVDALIKALPADQDALKIEAADNLKLLVDAATAEKPKRKWYSVSAEGLLEAAEFTKEFSSKIAGTIGQLGKLLWPDFALSEAQDGE